MVPVILATVGVAAAIGGLLYYEDSQKKKTPKKGEMPAPIIPPGTNVVKPPVPPILNQPGMPRLDPVPPSKDAPMPQPILRGTTAGGNPIVSITPINPDTGQPTVSDQLSTHGQAMPQAHALYDYLKAHGNAPSPELKALTLAFQRAHNASEVAKKNSSRLVEDGIYGTATSGALTVYTGNPILATAGSPPITIDPNNPVGPASYTGSNLYAYLKQHKNDKNDPTLKKLVLEFQKAVNIDPLFPGPSSKIPSAKIIKERLTEDGLYGPKTSDALAVVSFERIKP